VTALAGLWIYARVEFSSKNSQSRGKTPEETEDALEAAVAAE
jgi:hypothetical protein